MTKQKKKEKKLKLKKKAIRKEKLKSKAGEVKPLMLSAFNKSVKASFKASEKERKKFKKQSKILDRKYVQGEVHFPIYVFNSSLERTVKIKNLQEMQFMGLHLGTILTCIRDRKAYSKHYFSYNKHN